MHILKSSKTCGGRRARHRAFTLIELLVVVSIILVLAGISLKVMSIVSRKAATARTIMVLEQVKGALGGYYAAYGSYPNVSGTSSTGPYILPSTRPSNMSNTVGLSSCLVSWNTIKKRLGTGYKGGVETMGFYNDDARRWDYYWEKVGNNIWMEQATTNSSADGSVYKMTNLCVRILDGWGHDVLYSSTNQQSYRLWSMGANGQNNNGGGDDIEVTFQ